MRIAMPLATVGAILLVGLCAGCPDRVHSYAYVTSAEHDTDGNGHWYCRFGAQLPTKILDHAPAGAPPELLAHATWVHDSFDEFGDCNKVLHTWLPATFDPTNRSAASLSWEGHGFWAEIVHGIILLAICAVIGWWLKRRRKNAAALKASLEELKVRDDSRSAGPGAGKGGGRA